MLIQPSGTQPCHRGARNEGGGQAGRLGERGGRTTGREVKRRVKEGRKEERGFRRKGREGERITNNINSAGSC